MDAEEIEERVRMFPVFFFRETFVSFPKQKKKLQHAAKLYTFRGHNFYALDGPTLKWNTGEMVTVIFLGGCSSEADRCGCRRN